AESITRSLEQQEETAKAQREGLEAQAAEVQQQVTSALSRAQSSWREQLSKEVETAQAQASERLDTTLAEAQDRGAGGLNEHLRSLVAQFKEETRSEEHTSELQSRGHLVCRLLLEKKKT